MVGFELWEFKTRVQITDSPIRSGLFIIITNRSVEKANLFLHSKLPYKA